jgi:predicted nucleotidyltransferase
MTDLESWSLYEKGHDEFLGHVVQICALHVLSLSKRSITRRVFDVRHYLGEDWRFANHVRRIRDMVPGRARDKANETFRISVYNGHSLSNDPDFLRARSWAITEYTQLLDEEREDEDSSQSEIHVEMSLWEQDKRRSSAVSGMGDLAPR